jgi:anti-sigma factor RsiW
MSSGTPISDDDLHALADGRLPDARADEVSAHLEESSADASRVAFYRRLNSDLHGLFDPVLNEPVPGRLLAAGYGRKRAWPLQAAAAVVLLAVGVGSGWFAHQYMAARELPAIAFTENAAQAHLAYVSEVRHPVEVAAAESDHLQKWLSKRLQNNVSIPNLTKVGYEFLGGRLLPAGDGVAAQLMYQNSAGNRVTLYFTHGGESDTAFRYLQAEGLSVFYWRDAKFTYALSSELPREDLLTICNAVYGQINPEGPAVEW